MIHCQTTSFITRKAFEPGGFGYILNSGNVPVIPPQVAGYMVGEGKKIPVTWKEIHNLRRQKQRERLERIRMANPPEWQPVLVWAFLVRGWLFEGWWCYLRTLHDRPFGRKYLGGYGPKGNITHDSGLALSLMKNIPLGIIPHPSNFTDWMIAFSNAHPKPRTRRDPRQAGILAGWSDGRSFSLRNPHRAPTCQPTH